MEEKQALFDKVLAKTIKSIYTKGTDEKIAQTIQKNPDKVMGVKAVTGALINKVQHSSNGAIPREMLPDLYLAITSQVGDIANATGANLSEEQIAQAYQGIIEDQTKKSLETGSRTPEEIQAGIQALSPQEAPSEAQQTVLSGQTQPTPAPTMPRGQEGLHSGVPTMTQRLAGGLIK